MIDKFALYDKLGYSPGEGQRAFHESDARIKVACCPRRAGKSYSAARDVEPWILLPNTRGWIIGASYDLGEKEFRYIYDDLVIGRERLGLPKPKKQAYNVKAGDMYLKFPWGSEVKVKSADNPSSLLGEELDWCIMSEAAQTRNEIYERYVHPTLLVRKGRTLIPTTPQMGADWVWSYYELGQQSNEVGVESFNWSVSENPNFPMEEFDNAKVMVEKGVMSEEAFREQYLGEWVLYTGAVFKAFRPKRNVIEPRPIPPHWKKVRGIDFGARDPFCCLWVAFDERGTGYVYREYYETGEPSTKEHAERIKDMSAPDFDGPPDYAWTVADKSGAQLRIDLATFGVPSIPSENNSIRGAEMSMKAVMRGRISEYLRPDPDTDKPSLYIFSTCKNLIRELKLLRWKEGTGVDGQREHTVGDDHAIDPLGYILLRRPKPRPKKAVVPFNSFEFWKKTKERERRRERMMVIG